MKEIKVEDEAGGEKVPTASQSGAGKLDRTPPPTTPVGLLRKYHNSVSR